MVNIEHDASLLTASQVARLLGISRVAVFKRIKAGKLPAKKIGRIYFVAQKDVANVLSTIVTDKQHEIVVKGVSKTVKEYEETLRLLGKE